jgi:hypothetical protein
VLRDSSGAQSDEEEEEEEGVFGIVDTSPLRCQYMLTPRKFT